MTDTQLGALSVKRANDLHEHTKAVVVKINATHRITSNSISKVRSGDVMTETECRVERG